MKKIVLLMLVFLLFVCTEAVGASIGYKWDMYKTDSVLIELMGISFNDPLLDTTTRWGYLQDAAYDVSSQLEIAPFMENATLGTNESHDTLTTENILELYGVLRYADEDTAYALIEIRGKDVGQKEIYTEVVGRYFWRQMTEDGQERIYVYPPNTTDTIGVRLFGKRASSDFNNLRQIAHHIILYRAMGECYGRMQEDNIAMAWKSLAKILLYDLKNNLENRPIDKTLAKRLLSK